MRVFTCKEQAKTWKSGPEAAKRENKRFTSGSLHENDNVEAAGQTWKSGCEAFKPRTEGFVKFNRYRYESNQFISISSCWPTIRKSGP